MLYGISLEYKGYFITSCGRVWSYKSNRFLTPCKDDDGYLRVCLSIDNKHFNKGVHRLVAETYLPNPNNYDTVDHIDFDKTNNCLNNLQWMSRSENSRKKARQGCENIETGQRFKSITEAAKFYGKSRECLSNHLRGKQNTFAGCHWRYTYD